MSLESAKPYRPEPLPITRTGAVGIVSVALAVGLVTYRLFEQAPTWLDFARFALSLGAIALACYMPRVSFFKRAVTFVALESVAGIILFGFVDAPVVLNHRTQIVTSAASLQAVLLQLQLSVSLQE